MTSYSDGSIPTRIFSTATAKQAPSSRAFSRQFGVSMTGIQAVKPGTTSFCYLPTEIIQQILPEIELHRDLVNFARASRLCSQLVIPRQTEYRALFLGNKISAPIWAHLACRPDLASNIRDVDIELHTGRYRREPSVLIEDVDLEERPWEVQEAEIIQALGHMRRLKSFAWEHQSIRPTPPELDQKHFPPMVFDILYQIGTVEHLFLFICDRLRFNEPIAECGLWKMSQLRSLVLSGSCEDWPSESKGNAIVLRTWLINLTSLELLDLPRGMFEEHHEFLSFPKLRYFRVNYPDGNEIVIDFLARHPSIQELFWHSTLNFTKVPSNFLPKLRRFAGRYDFIKAMASQTLIDQGEPRQFEALTLNSILEAGYFDDLCACPGIDHQALRILRISSDDWNIHKLAAVFPMLEELYLPSRNDFNFDDFLSGIEQFKALKMLYWKVVWGDLVIEDPDSGEPEYSFIDERVRTLGSRCPSLVQIGHPVASDRYLSIYRENGEVSAWNEHIFPNLRPLGSRFEMDSYT
ncbi:hypothetical protein BDN72DRAFT_961284 [Pluteus cervinus]|uniref:Uncharacterized protein n=1 Tax=Pluteus cervinus TaxID=181527 RepID=A0ACD3AN70_9AGAR|nr:hypothetical protein BDN72DRAFT_961284 [Pluteus cervinus]